MHFFRLPPTSINQTLLKKKKTIINYNMFSFKRLQNIQVIFNLAFIVFFWHFLGHFPHFFSFFTKKFVIFFVIFWVSLEWIACCYRTVSNVIWEIFSEFFIFCKLFHEPLGDWNNSKIWGTRKIFIILYKAAYDNYFIVKCLLKSNVARVISLT